MEPLRIVFREDLPQRRRAPVVQEGRRPEELDEFRGVEDVVRSVELAASADVVRLKIRTDRPLVAADALRLAVEEVLALFRSGGKLAIDEEGAGLRLKTCQVCDECLGELRLGHVTEEEKTFRHRVLETAAHAASGRGLDLVTHQQGACPLRCAETVVHEVPTKSVRPPIVRVAGRATHPALETNVGVVKDLFAATRQVRLAAGAQGDGRRHLAALCVGDHDGSGVVHGHGEPLAVG